MSSEQADIKEQLSRALNELERKAAVASAVQAQRNRHRAALATARSIATDLLSGCRHSAAMLAKARGKVPMVWVGSLSAPATDCRPIGDDVTVAADGGPASSLPLAAGAFLAALDSGARRWEEASAAVTGRVQALSGNAQRLAAAAPAIQAHTATLRTAVAEDVAVFRRELLALEDEIIQQTPQGQQHRHTNVRPPQKLSEACGLDPLFNVNPSDTTAADAGPEPVIDVDVLDHLFARDRAELATAARLWAESAGPEGHWTASARAGERHQCTLLFQLASALGGAMPSAAAMAELHACAAHANGEKDTPPLPLRDDALFRLRTQVIAPRLRALQQQEEEQKHQQQQGAQHEAQHQQAQPPPSTAAASIRPQPLQVAVPLPLQNGDTTTVRTSRDRLAAVPPPKRAGRPVTMLPKVAFGGSSGEAAFPAATTEEYARSNALVSAAVAAAKPASNKRGATGRGGADNNSASAGVKHDRHWSDIPPPPPLAAITNHATCNDDDVDSPASVDAPIASHTHAAPHPHALRKGGVARAAAACAVAPTAATVVARTAARRDACPLPAAASRVGPLSRRRILIAASDDSDNDAAAVDSFAGKLWGAAS